MSETPLEWPWADLGIAPTDDTRAIRRAYAVRLKTTRPDDNPEGYLALRKAFEFALQIGSSEQDDADTQHEDGAVSGHHSDAPGKPEHREPEVTPSGGSFGGHAAHIEYFLDGLHMSLEPRETAPRQPQWQDASQGEPVPEWDEEDPLVTLQGLLEQPEEATLNNLDQGALKALCDAVQAALFKLSLDQETQAAMWGAQWILNHPQAPVAIIATLSRRFDWTGDFRVSRLMDPADVVRLRDILSAADLGQHTHEERKRPTSTSALRAWIYMELRRAHLPTAWAVAICWGHRLKSNVEQWGGLQHVAEPQVRNAILERLDGIEWGRWILSAMLILGWIVVERQGSFDWHAIVWNVVSSEEIIGIMVVGTMIAGIALSPLVDLPDRWIERLGLANKLQGVDLWWQHRELFGVAGCFVVMVGQEGAIRMGPSLISDLWMIGGAVVALLGLLISVEREFLVRVALWAFFCIVIGKMLDDPWAHPLRTAAWSGMILGAYLHVARRWADWVERWHSTHVRTLAVGNIFEVLLCVLFGYLASPTLPLVEARQGHPQIALRWITLAGYIGMMSVRLSPFVALAMVSISARVADTLLDRAGWFLAQRKLGPLPLRTSTVD